MFQRVHNHWFAAVFAIFYSVWIGTFSCAQDRSQSDQTAAADKRLSLPGESFLVDGHVAFVLLPPGPLRQSPQPWIHYAPTLPAYPDSHEKWMHEQFLAAGIAVAGIDAGEAYGSPEGQRLMTALHDELTQNRDFAARPCLLGRSRGGLCASSWAIANPDKVAGIAGIYPVFDLQTYPGLDHAASAYGITTEQLKSQLASLNPISKVDVLGTARVPVFIIHGDDDTVVPLKENSATLADRYDFQVDGHPVLVVAPTTPAPGRPWLWHGEFFGHRPEVDVALLEAGSDIAYMSVPNQLGSPTAVKHWNRFYETLTKKYILSAKPALIGLSRGGLYCYNWAAANPGQVAGIYGEAPVCDFKRWPGGRGAGKGSPKDWQWVIERYGFASEAEVSIPPRSSR